MSRKMLLYVVVALLLIIAGGLITGQFDIHPLVGIAITLGIIMLAAAVMKKKGD